MSIGIGLLGDDMEVDGSVSGYALCFYFTNLTMQIGHTSLTVEMNGN